MSRSRSIIIAGAGIGGLTAALALVRTGHRVVILEAARQLTEAGAGIQLSPNATRVLATLDIAEHLIPKSIGVEAIRIMSGRSGREIVRIPLSDAIASRYSAPYWTIHRGDLQRALLDAVEGNPDIVLRLGVSFVDHAVHANGVTVIAKTQSGVLVEEHGLAVVGADGLWSQVRSSLGHRPPRFRKRTAWRTLLPADAVDPRWREAMTNLWLGSDAHLVHYPVKGGSAINVVATMKDRNEAQGWSNVGAAKVLLTRFQRWSPDARAILAAAASWQTWSLYALSSPRWGRGPATLLGDASHAMLPFLAQGGALAIEDAAVLASCVARSPGDIAQAFRSYEGLRQARVARASRSASWTGVIYHLKGPLAAARNRVMQRLGDEKLLERQNWLYDWTNS